MTTAPTPHRPPRRRWVAEEADRTLVADLARGLGVPPILARVLAHRGVEGVDDGRRFLSPSIEYLGDPFAMADMDRAADRVCDAIRAREPVLVFGDRDVDGLTGTALLVDFLRALGGDPQVYVPNRATEGYSFTDKAVREVLATGARVVISVDNGTTSGEPVAALQRAGVDVIVTDHHLPDEHLAPAFAVVNPRRHDCAYPFKGLAGVGVAFKLTCAVAERLESGKRLSPQMRRFLQDAMAWVAMGTVADMVPLSGENRVLTALGLPAIPRSSNPGLRALCAVAGVGEEPCRAETVGFQLAPRLNAAGRLGRSDLSLELLTTRDAARADQLAGAIDGLNIRRRELDRQIFEAVQPRLARLPRDEAIALRDPAWPAGILGLVANRITQQERRPAALVTTQLGDVAKGSCRSVPGFDVKAALEECAEHLQEFGGHAMAAGMTLAVDRVEPFLAAFRQTWKRALEGGVEPPVERYDGEVALAVLTPRLMADLDRLQPCGQGNPRPRLAARGLRLLNARRMGRDRTHLALEVAQGPVSFRAVGFGMGELHDALVPGLALDALFTPKINRFRGRTSIELELADVRAAEGDGRTRSETSEETGA